MLHSGPRGGQKPFNFAKIIIAGVAKKSEQKTELRKRTLFTREERKSALLVFVQAAHFLANDPYRPQEVDIEV